MSGPAVQLSIPASARYLRLARLAAAGLADDLGYTNESVEDVRVAVDELCSAIIDDAGPSTDLALVYRLTPRGLVIEGSCEAHGDQPPALNQVAQDLLTILTDEYSIDAVDGCRSFRLLKYAS